MGNNPSRQDPTTDHHLQTSSYLHQLHLQQQQLHLQQQQLLQQQHLQYQQEQLPIQPQHSQHQHQCDDTLDQVPSRKQGWSGSYNQAGQPEGNGVFYYPPNDPSNRNYYQGNMLDGKRHGQGGILRWRDGNVYIGEWIEDRLEGDGEFRWSDGKRYIGKWYRNQPLQGSLHYLKGKRYEGHFVSGKRHGQGRIMWPEFDEAGRVCYTGNWVDDKKSGFGTMTWKDGTSYEGFWVKGKREGNGVYTFPAGEYYSGNWVNGLRQGYGVRVYADGSIYEGEWKGDRRHGRGQATDVHGRVSVELWDMGVKVPHGLPQIPQSLVVLCIERIAADPIFQQEHIARLPIDLNERVVKLRTRLVIAHSRDISATNSLHLKDWFNLR